MVERVVGFYDSEDENIYIETDDALVYFMPLVDWETLDVPETIINNPLAKATYLLHYTDNWKSICGDD